MVFFACGLVLVRFTAGGYRQHMNAASNEFNEYRDCDGTSMGAMKEVFKRDGILMFTPCSLAEADDMLASMRSHIDKACEPNDQGASMCANRIQDSKNANVSMLAINSEILNVIETLHNGRKPFPFQTLNFKFGTAQPIHSDLIHFAGFPSFTMTAAWVALEDVSGDSGPLEYYIGSHEDQFQTMDMLSCPLGVYRSCYEKRMREYVLKHAKKWQKKSMLPRKGQVVIWASNALHGGGPIKNPKSHRYSQVTHYFFDDDDFFFVPQLSVSENGHYNAFAIKQRRSKIRAQSSLDTGTSILHVQPTRAFQKHFSENLHNKYLKNTGYLVQLQAVI